MDPSNWNYATQESHLMEKRKPEALLSQDRNVLPHPQKKELQLVNQPDKTRMGRTHLDQDYLDKPST